MNTKELFKTIVRILMIINVILIVILLFTNSHTIAYCLVAVSIVGLLCNFIEKSIIN